MTQRQEFTVLKKFGDFELRQYLPCVLAEVKVSADYSSAGSIAFRSLFSYIALGNSRAEKIAMTAPVIAATQDTTIDDNQWSVSFVMPAGSSFSDLPDPNDPRVVLRDLDTEICVATSFRGRANQEAAQKQVAELRMAAARENINLSDETRICRFDPPMKPGFMQYNEIVIPAFL
ncbi:SOUL haem-binding protein [Candidatus Nanopelagicaceae bacterium]